MLDGYDRICDMREVDHSLFWRTVLPKTPASVGDLP